ncbi:MAG: 5-oxoprolinase subunit PxpA [Bacteroidota bacterium]
MPQSIDINCDMGEGMETDVLILPFISSASIACGYHAGNEDTIKRTIELCLENGVAAGAHPSFFDKENFGRKEQYLSAEEVYQLVGEQLYIFEKLASPMGCVMHHVKPHGALYNMAANDRTLSNIVAKAVGDFDENLLVYGLCGSHFISEAAARGLRVANEVFADRSYQDDGTLTPRSQTGALIEEDEKALQQVLQMINTQTVTAQSGNTFPIKAETICIHGDGAHAVSFAHTIHQYLKGHHIEIKTI